MSVAMTSNEKKSKAGNWIWWLIALVWLAGGFSRCSDNSDSGWPDDTTCLPVGNGYVEC